jgi:hypothetical protein
MSVMLVRFPLLIRRLVERRSLAVAFSTGTAALIALAGCGSSSAVTGRVTAPGVPELAHWTPLVHVLRPLDLAGPRSDGSLVLAAGGRLMLLDAAAASVRPFAPAYHSPGGEEPYIALATSGCLASGGRVYALHLRPPRGVVSIDPRGPVRGLARISAPGLIDGIAFDGTGAFGHRLLVTTNHGSTTTVNAVECHGAVTTVTRSAPRVEGGIAVAPRSFGRFAGDLIAPDEKGGNVYAITPSGQSLLVAASGLPHGPDTGVESAGFVPNGNVDALMADRVSPGNRHPGDDVVLRIGHAALAAVGVRPGDLLVATEGGARTISIRCTAAGCRVRHVADGPAIAHGEGHIAFAPTS